MVVVTKYHLALVIRGATGNLTLKREREADDLETCLRRIRNAGPEWIQRPEGPVQILEYYECITPFQAGPRRECASNGRRGDMKRLRQVRWLSQLIVSRVAPEAWRC